RHSRLPPSRSRLPRRLPTELSTGSSRRRLEAHARLVEGARRLAAMVSVAGTIRRTVVICWGAASVACGGESLRTVPKQQAPLPCGLEPWDCIEADTVAIQERHPLEPSNPGFNDTLEPGEYVQPLAPGCDRSLVFDIGSEELSGDTLMIG